MILSATSAAGNRFLHIRVEEDTGAADSTGRTARLARWLCRDDQPWKGGDGLILYHPQRSAADFSVFNRDGSQAEISGNGMAGLAALLFRADPQAKTIRLRTRRGSRNIRLLHRGDPEFLMRVEIGPPDFHNTVFFPFLEPPRSEYTIAGIPVHPVSVGNPHAVVFATPLPAQTDAIRIGQMLSRHAAFPQETNVEFVDVIDSRHCQVYFFERGVGPTGSSSTGSAAVYAVLRSRQEIGGSLSIRCPGGSLSLSGKRSIYIRNLTRIEFQQEIVLPDEFRLD